MITVIYNDGEFKILNEIKEYVVYCMRDGEWSAVAECDLKNVALTRCLIKLLDKAEERGPKKIVITKKEIITKTSTKDKDGKRTEVTEVVIWE